MDCFKLQCEFKRDISIDESLFWWKERLSWKQYIPKRRSRFGLKAFVLSKGSTNYVWNIILYAGIDMLPNENIDSDYHGAKVVVTLMEDLLHKKQCVYINIGYPSIDVCNGLNNNTAVVRTL